MELLQTGEGSESPTLDPARTLQNVLLKKRASHLDARPALMAVPRTELRPLCEADRPRVETWLTRPHVSAWWGDPCEVSMQVWDPEASLRIIELDGRSAGLIRSGLGMLHGAPAVTLDILLAEVDDLGQGHGSRALALRDQELDTSLPLLGRPSIDNLRAIRAYEKAGFTRQLRLQDPVRGRCWCMVRTTR